MKALVFYKYKDLYSSAMEAYPYSATVAIQPSMKASQQYLSTHLVKLWAKWIVFSIIQSVTFTGYRINMGRLSNFLQAVHFEKLISNEESEFSLLSECCKTDSANIVSNFLEVAAGRLADNNTYKIRLQRITLDLIRKWSYHIFLKTHGF